MSESSQTVQTVLGPIPLAKMGLTLMHEHLLLDATAWHHPPNEASRMALRDAPVTIELLGELRMDPFVNLENTKLHSLEDAASEVQAFADLGGRTVLETTPRGIGRDAQGLQAIARRSGLNVIMGCGYYLEPSHPPQVRHMNSEDIALEIMQDLGEGVDGSGIRAGFIGEIGVGAQFSAEEEKSLRGAARAQARTGLPLMVHLPGWKRLGHRVLDVVLEEGADAHKTILCHMNPSWRDLGYQMALAERGAFLEYDMISMDFFYADQQAQCPSDEENAGAIKTLIDAGYLKHLLISQDVFLRMMLQRYGGFGYGYILRHFVPRLLRHDVTRAQVDTLLIENPMRVFSM
jgi:phosphotriesterase-related protein